MLLFAFLLDTGFSKHPNFNISGISLELPVRFLTYNFKSCIYNPSSPSMNGDC